MSTTVPGQMAAPSGLLPTRTRSPTLTTPTMEPSSLLITTSFSHSTPTRLVSFTPTGITLTTRRPVITVLPATTPSLLPNPRNSTSWETSTMQECSPEDASGLPPRLLSASSEDHLKSLPPDSQTNSDSGISVSPTSLPVPTPLDRESDGKELMSRTTP